MDFTSSNWSESLSPHDREEPAVNNKWKLFSLKNNQLNFITAWKLWVNLSQFIDHTPNKYRKTGECNNITGWTCKCFVSHIVWLCIHQWICNYLLSHIVSHVTSHSHIMSYMTLCGHITSFMTYRSRIMSNMTSHSHDLSHMNTRDFTQSYFGREIAGIRALVAVRSELHDFQENVKEELEDMKAMVKLFLQEVQKRPTCSLEPVTADKVAPASLLVRVSTILFRTSFRT